MTGTDRGEVSRGIAQGLTGQVIAVRIGRDPSVVSREIARHGGRERYRATRAAARAAADRRRPKMRKLDVRAALRADVVTRLRAGCSPGPGRGPVALRTPWPARSVGVA